MQWAESTYTPFYSQLNGFEAENPFLFSNDLATGVLHVALACLGAFNYRAGQELLFDIIIDHLQSTT